ncbi:MULTISPECIES: YqgE/AlgH family protein [Burkholderiaceae]|uniref:YqgE/AlgH family protein n=1 Tax=Burkholderiaceae TaxID=119060 RepID=UPI00095CC377|nr:MULTISPECIES: YqgE/AlgH family protein [Burkholderiaceae]MCF2134735.1 YqgE/AlgH family protein [Mycetohabitans sp. B3]MCG1019242.1 YqgE/AlgH family protein [Mycetohabitans sp. B4]MCG1040039.1 YqgE/AlgH family protein [Mycetohabitans sp. B7]SIT72397.1 putative transcriptional regulator [Burkholderia sp. b14]SIT72783.1 putative transcriptional regulator [Burkholderia sp. b13]
MSKTTDRINLTNQFLIAMPSMADPTFSGTVVYLCDHSERGAFGLVINRPTDIDLQALFSRIDLKLEIEPLLHVPVYFGGPVQTERGFVLHDPVGSGNYTSSMSVPSGLEMTTSKDVLEAVANGNGPKRFLLTLGHAGWGAGQLEDEISKNGWLTVEADPKIVFDVPAEQRFDAALALLGISSTMLSGEAGHA